MAGKEIKDTMDIADRLEREEALDFSRSFIVQAPAGSGKTELLMQRYLNLLTVVERPEQILAMTFTKKAASEMHSRIMGSIIRARDGVRADTPHGEKTLGLAGEALARDISLGWNLIENPGRLKIQTIDSFCSSLARQMPLLSRLGRQPSVSDDPEEHYMEAAALTLDMIEKDGPVGEPVRKTLRHLDNSVNSFLGRLVLMLGKRDQWLRHVKGEAGGDELRAALEWSLRRLIEDTLKEASAAFPAKFVQPLLRCARYAAMNLDKDGSVKVLEDIRELPGATIDDVTRWQGIRRLLITDKDGWRKPNGINKKNGFPVDSPAGREMKKEFQELLASLEDNEGLLKALSATAKLPSSGLDEDEWDILEALIRLLPAAEENLWQVFNKNGEVDFQAISSAALESLGTDQDPTDLMLSLDLKIRHILVDEYQDTSRTQLQLLQALTRGWEQGDGRTLFIVGDPMQSIFQFREAEVGLFLQAKDKGVGGIKLDSLTLNSNFRSEPGIIGWVNGVFEGAFPEKEDTFTGSVIYSPSIAAKKDGGSVEISLFDGRDDAAEARKVVSIIRESDEDDSIAILCRSRTHLQEVVRSLKKEGIEFRAEEFDPLRDRTVIQDLFALLRALMHPFDMVAWLAVLRAPWCGLSLEDLHRISGFTDKPVWASVNDGSVLESLSDEGRKRVRQTACKLRAALGKRGRVPLSGLLEGLWVGLGGPACVKDAESMKDAGLFFEAVSSAGEAGGLRSFKLLEARIDKLYANHGGSPYTKVELMTIHKAKGLEFDHVIIPGLGKKQKNEDKKLLLWMEREDDLLLAPIDRKAGRESPIYDYLMEINKNKAALEQVRLFYVACTRAKKRLCLLGHVNIKKDGRLKAAPLSLLSSIEHCLDHGMIIGKAPEPGHAAVAETKPMHIKRLPLAWKMPAPCDSIDSIVHYEVLPEKEPEFYWAGNSAKLLGTVLHRYLCRMAKEGITRWDLYRLRGEGRKIRAQLIEAGIKGDLVDKTVQRGMEILIKAVSDAKGRWILKEHAEGRVEYPVTGVLESGIAHAVIDRTFVDNGVRWVIDYKTSVHEGGSPEEFLEHEKERYREQLERYAEILRAAGEEREIKKGLYYPAMQKWIEW